MFIIQEFARKQKQCCCERQIQTHIMTDTYLRVKKQLKQAWWGTRKYEINATPCLIIAASDPCQSH